MDTITTYKCHIYNIYKFLKNSNKSIDNYNLSKIFEYYTCIILFEKYNKIFYEYNDIPCEFKENNNLTKKDSGIDCCDLQNTIVQCKLRKKYLNWKECSTFFGSSIAYNEDDKQNYIKWQNLFLCRNSNSVLSNILQFKKNLFTDIPIDSNEFIKYCDELYDNPPEYTDVVEEFVLRNYQIQSINLINNTNNNIVINLPTGTGKNVIIINSLNNDNKYLILVPRKVLMYQLCDEILKHKPQYKFNIQLIGDNHTNFDVDKNITICIYNSINKITIFDFTKIFIDEAHHIYTPIIYCNDEQIIQENIIDPENDDIIYLQPQDFSDYIEPDSEDETSDTESEFNEDTTDIELYDSKKYINIISELSKYKNNVYLSATIDEIPHFEYYKQDIRDMINNKYLCDYNINIPIFSENATNTDICNYLISNYKYIIIYCNSITEGQSINNTLNTILPNCSQYLDYKTSKSNVNKILTKYKAGDLLFLVNVRILIEGFDVPITNGVCFLHMPSSKTNAIQIIGRALRLHHLKSIANVILPYSRIDDDKDINKFLNILANNDSRLKTSYNNKKLGGYINISIENEPETESDENETETDENIFIRNKIYNSLGECLNYIDFWYKNLNVVLEYIKTNNKRPSSESKDKTIKSLGCWICNTKKNYKNKTNIMKNIQIYNKWTETINGQYKDFFIDNINDWYNKLNKILEYIKTNNKTPSSQSKDKTIKSLGQWITRNKRIYKNKTEIMKNIEIYNKWTEIINRQYKDFFIDNISDWYNKLNKVLEYIKTNNKRPSSHSKNENIKRLGSWISDNKKNYKNKTKIMKNIQIYNKWTETINGQNKNFFIDNISDWYNKLNKVLEYIKTNNKKPSRRDNDKNIKSLGQWINTTKLNYKNKTNIMKNTEIYNKWSEIINGQYKDLFK